MRYRHIAQEVDALQWTGDNFGQALEFVNQRMLRQDIPRKSLILVYEDGEGAALPGDWIVHDPLSSSDPEAFTVCSAKEFKKLFEAMD